MSAPKRWLDDAEGTLSEERELLRAGVAMEPPPGAEGEVWAALLAKIPPPGAPPPGDGGASAAKAASSAAKGAAASKAAGAATVAVGGGLVKSALIGAGSAVALIATYTAVAPSTPDPSPPATTAVSIATVSAAPRESAPSASLAAAATVSASASAEPAPKPPAHVDARPAATALPSVTAEPEVARETMLREESKLVGEARDALRRGDAGSAIAMLEQIRARFPGGVLTQEREALTIEALARSGRRDEASARAASFLAAYPTSLLAPRVQSFVK